jgi:hypothetical protein
VIKIEFSGSGEEVRNEMLRLLGLQEPKAQTGSPVQDEKSSTAPEQPAPAKTKRGRKGRKTATPPSATWTEEETERLLNEIKPNARKIITELANKPDGYRRSDLIQEMGLKEQAIRGQLSSVGSALRRMDNKPSPIAKERVDGELIYRLNSVVAGVVKGHPVKS